MGWKRRLADSAPTCRECWQQRYVLRAITFSVAGPVDAEWPELREALKEAWGLSTEAANWMWSELYSRDIRRAAGVAKMPKMPKVYLYPEGRLLFPALPSQTLAAMEQAIKGKYRASRYEVIWTRAASLPGQRYPYPFGCPNQGWRAKYDEGGRPLVEVRIGSKRWTLRLRGGNRYRRQLGAFGKIVGGQAVQGELAIYRKRSSSNRNGIVERDSGGQKQPYDVMVKLVAWLPRDEWKEPHGTLYVRTDKDSLLIALNAKEEKLWLHHADHIKKWEAEHRRRLNRWSDDQKAEQRPVASFQSCRETAVKKYRNRLNSACHEAAAQLANYAARRRFAEVIYDDDEKAFCGRFPWFQLRELLSMKLDERGITLRIKGCEGSGDAKNPGTARKNQRSVTS